MIFPELVQHLELLDLKYPLCSPLFTFTIWNKTPNCRRLVPPKIIQILNIRNYKWGARILRIFQAKSSLSLPFTSIPAKDIMIETFEQKEH